MEKYFAKATTGGMPEIADLDKLMLDIIPNEVIVKRFHAENHRGMKRKEVICSSFYFNLSIFTFSLCLKMIFFFMQLEG